MILDKLLMFAENKAITTTADSDVIELDAKQGDEIARTLNLVAQLDDPKAVTPTTATITPKLQMDKGAGYVDVVTFPAVTVAQAIAGKRLINFAKLPLGGLGGKMKLVMTVSGGPLVGAKYTAGLTPSAEA